MTDETTNEELDAEDSTMLPNREMMSLISTDPSDQLAGLSPTPDKGPMPMEPADPPTPQVQPPSGDQMHTQTPAEGASSEPRSETISQSDSASAS